MKITQISLIFSIVAISSAIAASGQHAPVLDTDEEEVRVGESYYIVSTIRGAGGGGLTVRQSDCPRDVFQEGRDFLYGKPLRFHPVDPDDDVVRVSTDLNIEFDPIPSADTCNESWVWKLAFSGILRTSKLTTGGVVGNPGLNTIKNWFKIEKTPLGYKLVYNPTVSDAIPPFTGELGFNTDLGRRNLVLISSDSAFNFIIRKALPEGGRPFIKMISKT